MKPQPNTAEDKCPNHTQPYSDVCPYCASTPASVELENQNIKVNEDGTISPIDPTKPSKYLAFEPTDTSEQGVISAILLDMEWCHAVTTKSLDKAVERVEALLALSNQRLLRELLGQLPEEKRPKKRYEGRDTEYYNDGFNDCLTQVKALIEERLK